MASATAEELIGQVVGVTDGDTLTLLVPEGTSYRQAKVRLAEIDAPESGQPYGQKAKQALSDLAYGKTAQIAVSGKTRVVGAAGSGTGSAV
ncbi:MAG: thermonuclease family protein [Candidatus Contendobacter sp.]